MEALQLVTQSQEEKSDCAETLLVCMPCGPEAVALVPKCQAGWHFGLSHASCGHVAVDKSLLIWS